MLTPKNDLLPRRALAAALAFALSLGGVPTSALAEAVSEAGVEATAEGPARAGDAAGAADVAEEVPGSSDVPKPSDDPLGDDSAENSGTSAVGSRDENNPDALSANVEHDCAPESVDGANQERLSDLIDLPTVPSDGFVNNELALASSELAPSSAGAASFVVIQDEDKSSAYSARKGTVEPGATLWANLYDDSNARVRGEYQYQWLSSAEKTADLSSYSPIDGATSQCLTVSDELAQSLAGRYLAVRVTVGEEDYYGPGWKSASIYASDVPGPIVPAGTVELSGVKMEASSSVLQAGTVLSAPAYTGPSYSPTYVTEGVDYSWRYTTDDPTGYGCTWVPLENNGATYTVSSEDVGRYFSVEASTAAGKVSLSNYNALGPIRLEGQVDIYSVFLSLEGSSATTALYKDGDTLVAHAKEKGASDEIDPSLVTYQWQASENNKAWDDIDGATGQSLSLSGYEGKYVRCRVSAKVGGSSKESTSRNKVAPANAIAVSVTLDQSGQIAPGTTITATATNSQTGVDASDVVTWQWYGSDSQYSGYGKIEGANSRSYTPVDGTYKYLKAYADGGYGEAPSSSVGPVKAPGVVQISKVTVSNDASDGVISPGVTLTAKACTGWGENEVAPTDVVSYQWQYATTDSSDGSYDSIYFHDIPGATEKSYTIQRETIPVGDGAPVSLLGKYLRVRVRSENKVTSTNTAYYSSVHNIGPVKIAGAYDVSSVTLSSDTGALQVGVPVVAKAHYLYHGTYGSYERDLPSDAQAVYTWYVSDDSAGQVNARAVTPSEGAVGSVLTASEELTGKYVWVTAQSLLEPGVSQRVLVRPAGSFNVNRVSVNAGSSSKPVFVGSKVSAQVFSESLESPSGTGKNVTSYVGDGVSVQWYVADTSVASSAEEVVEGDWSPLVGATGPQLVVPQEAVGKYLRCVATSGSGAFLSSASGTLADKVLDSDSLEGMVAKLKDENWRPSPQYGVAGRTNVNDMLRARLSSDSADASGISISVKTVEFSSQSEGTSVGIATGDGAGNGDITFFSADAQSISTSNASCQTVRKLVYVLERDGESVEFEVPRTFRIPWDKAAARVLLEREADEIVIGYVEGDRPDSVTKDLRLPYKAGEGGSSTWTSVAWESAASDEADGNPIEVSGWGYSDYTGKVRRGAARDQKVTLTAKVRGLDNYGFPDGDDYAVTRSFEVVVKADPVKTEEGNAALEALVDTNYSYDRISYFGTGETIFPDGSDIVGDLQLPTSRGLGLGELSGTYGDFRVSYSASGSGIQVSGYRANVIRPLPGQAAADMSVTCTVSCKDNPAITYAKTLPFKVKPLDLLEIDAAESLMDRAVAGYTDAILDGQDAQAVTRNLHPFKRAYIDSQGRLAWSYSAGDAALGVVPADLDGYDAFGPYYQARTFRSSSRDLVLNETLLLAWNDTSTTMLTQFHEQPAYNAGVTIDSVLTDERYGRYYEAYKDDVTLDPALRAKLVKLYRSPASATLRVLGTTGMDNPNVPEPAPMQTAAVRVCAPSPHGPGEGADLVEWVPTTEVSFRENDGKTVWDLVAEVLEERGCSYVSQKSGYSPYSITSPDGRELASFWNYDSETGGSGSYWAYFDDGSYANTYVTSDEPKAGHTYELRYVDGSSTEEKSDVAVNPGTSHRELAADWGGFANASTGASTANDLTPTTYGKKKWAISLLTDAERSAYCNLSLSDSLILEGNIYTVAASVTYDSSFRAVYGLARMLVIDASTGRVLKEVPLAGSINSTCRLAYGKGIVVVPLAGGRVQALSAETLEPKWLTPAGVSNGTQSISTLTVDGDYVYVATADEMLRSDDMGPVATKGTVRRLNLLTGAMLEAQNENAGYYWAGGAAVDDYFILGDDSGTLTVYAKNLSEVVSSFRVSDAPLRSSIVSRGNDLYVVSRDGVLHRLALSSDGSLRETGSAKFASYSTSTPVISGNLAFVGGGDSAYGSGSVSVVDLETMTAQVVKTSDGKPFGEVKSTPLVVTNRGETYVYFTEVYAGPLGTYPYTEGGRLFAYRVGDAEATTLFQPEAGAIDSSMASVFLGKDGSLYYYNDSGHLFGICASASPASPSEESDSDAAPLEDDDERESGGDAVKDYSSPLNTEQIALSGNGDASPRGARAPMRRISLSAASPVSQQEKARRSLLADFTSERVGGSDGVASYLGEYGGDDTVGDARASLPTWPIVGMVGGLAGLAGMAAWHRRKRLQ